MKISDVIHQGVTDLRKSVTDPKTNIVLTKDGGVILFSNTGTGNVADLTLKKIESYCSKEIDTKLQEYFTDLALNKNRVIMRRSRSRTSLLAGDRSVYSKDLTPTIAALLKRHVVTPATPILLGDTKQLEGENIGTVRELLNRSFPPTKLQLYHGTSTKRLPDIKTTGLKPVPPDERVWNKGADATRHTDAVYLTAVRAQAEYYAKVAAQNDKAKPALVSVTLTSRDYPHLIADDDFAVTKAKGAPKGRDWMSSLSYYGQIAYKGTIPTSRLQVIATGLAARQKSQ